MPIFIGHFGCNEHGSKFVYVIAYEYACLSTIPLSFVVSLLLNRIWKNLHLVKPKN